MDGIVKKILLKVATVFCIQIMVLISVCFPVFAVIDGKVTYFI